MTGIKLWLLLLLLQGYPEVPYKVTQDHRECEVTIEFVGFRLLPAELGYEGQSGFDDASIQKLGYIPLEDTDHGELFRSLCYELDGEPLRMVHIRNGNDSAVVLSVETEDYEPSPQMEEYLDSLVLRVVSVVEAHFKIRCYEASPRFILPSDEEGVEGGEIPDDNSLPPEPVLPPEGWQLFIVLTSTGILNKILLAVT